MFDFARTTAVAAMTTGWLPSDVKTIFASPGSAVARLFEGGGSARNALFFA
jgi:hypothetical protein